MKGSTTRVNNSSTDFSLSLYLVKTKSQPVSCRGIYKNWVGNKLNFPLTVFLILHEGNLPLPLILFLTNYFCKIWLYQRLRII